jgi:hypothetical protein
LYFTTIHLAKQLVFIVKYNTSPSSFASKMGASLEISNENPPTKESIFGRPVGRDSGPSINDEKPQGNSRSRSSLGFEYEAQVQIIKQKHGDLEAIRHRLGLSRRKISQILMVDPSAWTRWTKKGEDAPAHVYRSLEWYLLLQNKYPGMDSPFWLEAIARPARTAGANLDIEKLQARLTQQLETFQRKLRWTQVGLVSTIALSALIIGLIACSSPQISTNFVANSGLHEVALPEKAERELAEKFAPIFMHEVGSDSQADLFGPVDYDNDWISDNNWTNLEKFDVNPMSYYEVVSTSSHYFITYAVFHPRDYSWFCLPIVCHENDMEGVLVVVDRATMKWTYTESVAHNYVFSQENKQDQARPTVLIEWGGHGIYPPDQYQTSRLTKVYNPQIYALEPIAKLWNLQFKETKLFDQTFDYEGERFRLAGVPIAFRGRKWSDNRANPPWAWPDYGQGKRGDLFLDPALYISRKHPGTRMSLDYDRHPYVKPKVETASIK